ncbi:relA/spoT family protein [Haloimpatiens lingqiaonensis]|uniref:relA/spoT family protein n=1 Tax=Haloimpatiens lingqiaonensis TaxID=1380675 RepID=UPI0010FF0C46|nr:relA/spoT family protein [Haloimpatiens lingqiaonensis]
MVLQMFEFIDEVVGILDKWRDDLDHAANNIEKYLEQMIVDDIEGYLNISSRVKSSSSLKEKILRNNYYKKYNQPKELFEHLSDLIGVRIECRFIEDENKMYKLIKKNFNMVHEDGLYYNKLNPNIRLDLRGKQPQTQKNGCEIYRIDGVYEVENTKINFELQIKSLVDIFWGEIEHKIIYKNYNYMLVDKFMKEMMDSIRKNLSMIDNQLLILYNQFNKTNSLDAAVRKHQMEMMLSKIIYDIFSSKIKKDIGFIMDFRKSCDIIMEYIFRTNNAEHLDDYNETLLKTLNRLNDISKDQVDFNSKITFEREIEFNDEFSTVIGESILGNINSDFNWNLFFRMLFQIELGNNAEDFENFISFLKYRFGDKKVFKQLYYHFKEEEADNIRERIIMEIANSFKEINSIEFIYEEKIENINKITMYMVKVICRNISSYEQWIKTEEGFMKLLRLKIFGEFGYEIEMKDIWKLISRFKECCNNINASKELLSYVNNLEKASEVRKEAVLKVIQSL